MVYHREPYSTSFNNLNGKESEKGYTYICKQLNHFAAYLKLTQHCQSAMLQLKEILP